MMVMVIWRGRSETKLKDESIPRKSKLGNSSCTILSMLCGVDYSPKSSYVPELRQVHVSIIPRKGHIISWN